MELLKFLVKEKGFNPKEKNDIELFNKENLLFATVKVLHKYSLKKTERKVLPMIKYLVRDCKLDINEKNIYNETFLYKILSITCHNEIAEKNKYKIIDYLFKNHKIKIDTNTKLLLQKNFIAFLKHIYPNIKIK